MEYKDYYKILGVGRGAARDEIKRAYRKLARKYHPDVSKEPDAEERFKEINEAHEVLTDPKKRAAYDRLGSRWKSGQEFHPPPGWEGHFEFRTEDLGDLGRFSDFFQSLFGGRPLFRQGPRGRGFKIRGEDQHARIQISLDDAYHGTRQALQLQLPEYDSDGTLMFKRHSLNIKVPAGVYEGQHIRLSGQGGKGTGGGANGDLYLEVQFTPHPLFRAVQRDIYLNLPVAPWEAALGASLQVPTLGGRVEVKIPPGSQSGAKLRLKGRGLPGKTPGSQYLLLQIMTPPAHSEREKALYQEMAHTFRFDPRRTMEG